MQYHTFYRRLLSGIPISMADNDPDDNPELLCKLMHQWGNNERALKMTSTFQMLIEGRRKGQKQVAWQKYIYYAMSDFSLLHCQPMAPQKT